MLLTNPSEALALVAAGSAAIGAIVTGLFSFLSRRRITRGTVNTSQAEILWSQIQSMLTVTQARLDRTEEQRDKLIDSYQHVGPALESLNSAMEHLSVQISALLLKVGGKN